MFYEPEIMTEVRTDGSKNSQIVVRVYPDRNNKDVSTPIPYDLFIDKVYFDVKDLYEDYEEKNFVIEENIDHEADGEIFGWHLTDAWHHVGNVYYFMLSCFNLIETQKDESPIIDTRGNIQGKVQYSVGLQLFDSDGVSKLNILDYETLNELIGKTLKITFELKKASSFPEKYCGKVVCKYEWLDSDSHFETKTCEKEREPDFNYVQEHTCVVTEHLINHLMYNTLTVGVYGMVESRKKNEGIRANKDGSTAQPLNTEEKQQKFTDQSSRLRELER